MRIDHIDDALEFLAAHGGQVSLVSRGDGAVRLTIALRSDGRRHERTVTCCPPEEEPLSIALLSLVGDLAWGRPPPDESEDAPDEEVRYYGRSAGLRRPGGLR